MRCFNLFSAICIFLVICGSCAKQSQNEDNPENEGTLTVNCSEILMQPFGGKSQLQLKASHKWTAVYDNWISLSKPSGEGYSGFQFLDVQVEKNASKDKRIGIIEFSMPEVGKKIKVVVTQAGEIETISIAEFCKKPVNEKDWYFLRGTITSIEGTYFGNFYIKDETGEILIYGMTSSKSNSNDNTFESIGLKEGDILTLGTLRGEYHGQAQGGGNKIPAYYIYHEEGETPSPVYKDFKANSCSANWMELPATSDEDGIVFLFHGMKIGSQPFRNYSAYYDQNSFISKWVAYPLERKSIGNGKRIDVWGFDPLVPEDKQANIISGNYKNAEGDNYVRGHQLPSADRTAMEANSKTFYSTNITPQNYTFNGGIWVKVEEKVRSWAKDSDTDTLYVVTGCVIDGSEKYVYDLNGHKVTVPVGYYKTVLRLSKGEYTANAFYFEHKPNTDTDIKKYSISVDELEEKTGVDFFVNLPAAVGEAKANAIEAADPASESFWWN